MTVEPHYDPTFLRRYGDTPEAAQVRLVKELESFEACLPEFQAHWETPLHTLHKGVWSPAQVTEHVVLANTSFSKVLYLLRREAALPEIPKVAGVIAEGKARAPQQLLPGEPQPWELLRPRWLETNERLLREVAATSQWHERHFFHPFFGELDALSWLQVAAFHTRHHHKQLINSAQVSAVSKS